MYGKLWHPKRYVGDTPPAEAQILDFFANFAFKKDKSVWGTKLFQSPQTTRATQLNIVQT